MSTQILPLSEPTPPPEISVVIPVFNEEDNLRELGERLIRTLTGMDRPFEIIFGDDPGGRATHPPAKAFARWRNSAQPDGER